MPTTICSASQICDELEITLYGSGIDDQSLTYHLNAAEKEVLREKMDAYCMQREHKPLEQLCQELLQEQDVPIPGDAAVTNSVFRAAAPVSGDLCGFPDTAERVPAKYQKTGRCDAVQERCKNEKGDKMSTGFYCEEFPAEQNGRQVQTLKDLLGSLPGRSFSFHDTVRLR